MKGIVKWFNGIKGYGFIVGDDDHKEYFVHFSDIKSNEDFKTLTENEKVEFEAEQDEQGRDKATKVKAI